MPPHQCGKAVPYRRRDTSFCGCAAAQSASQESNGRFSGGGAAKPFVCCSVRQSLTALGSGKAAGNFRGPIVLDSTGLCLTAVAIFLLRLRRQQFRNREQRTYGAPRRGVAAKLICLESVRQSLTALESGKPPADSGVVSYLGQHWA